MPSEVGQVVARTLAKKPEDRFQTVRDLRMSLTSAAENRTTPLALTDDEIRRNERLANRIIVSTGYGAGLRDNSQDVDDEITVVHPSLTGAAGLSPAVASGPPAPQSNGANSWRIAAIALIGVLILGGVLYAMTRNRPSALDQGSPPLTADPNSQPVKPAGAPTGQAERDIAPNVSLDSSNVNSNSNSNTSNTNDNQNTELPVDSNGNANTQQNSNSSGANNSPGSNSNKNSNSVGDGPSPKRGHPVKVDEAPPPPGRHLTFFLLGILVFWKPECHQKRLLKSFYLFFCVRRLFVNRLVHYLEKFFLIIEYHFNFNHITWNGKSQSA